MQYEGPENRWTIYPGALTKLSSTFAEGDCVRISSEEELVKSLQKGHGEWSEKMKMVSMAFLAPLSNRAQNFFHS